MKNVFWKRTIVLIAGTIGVWLAVRFLLPAALPFLLGGLLAVAAEPVVAFGTGRLKMPRGVASALGIALSLLILLGILTVMGGMVLRQLGFAINMITSLTERCLPPEGMLMTSPRKYSVVEPPPSRLKANSTPSSMNSCCSCGMLAPVE